MEILDRLKKIQVSLYLNFSTIHYKLFWMSKKQLTNVQDFKLHNSIKPILLFKLFIIYVLYAFSTTTSTHKASNSLHKTVPVSIGGVLLLKMIQPRENLQSVTRTLILPCYSVFYIFNGRSLSILAVNCRKINGKLFKLFSTGFVRYMRVCGLTVVC